MQVVQQVEVCL